jgi:2-dehydropantoate 2-reductase
VRLLLAGADSVIDNARTFKLAADNKIPATVYEGAAHSLVFEAPARVASDIAEIVADSELRQRHKRISVIGAGAVGSLVGGLLAVAGHDVTLVGRQRHCDAVRKTGLEIRVAAAFRRIVAGIRPLDAPDAAAKPADLVILAVKSPDTAPAIETLKSFVGPDTVILTLQNGLGHEALIAREFPGNPILAGILCAYLESPLPGTVVWYGDRTCLAATVFSGDPTKARAAWEAALPDTGIPSRFFIGPDMARSVKWSKLVLDSGFNASNAITSLPTARLLRDRQWGTIAVQAMSESFRVMRRLGVRPLNFPGYPLKRLAVLCRLPPVLARPVLAWFMRHEQGGPSSMAQDLKRGQGPTEIDALNGAIVRSADAHGVATPANRLLWDQMKSLASRPSETKS